MIFEHYRKAPAIRPASPAIQEKRGPLARAFQPVEKVLGLFRQAEQCLAFLSASHPKKLPLRGATGCCHSPFAFDSTRGGSRPPRTPPAKRNVFSPNRVLLTSGKARAAGPRFWRSVQASALTSRSPSPVPRAPAAAGAAPGSGPRTAPAESASGRAGRSGS